MIERRGCATLMAEKGLHTGHRCYGNGRIWEVTLAGKVSIYPGASRTPNSSSKRLDCRHWWGSLQLTLEQMCDMEWADAEKSATIPILFDFASLKRSDLLPFRAAFRLLWLPSTLNALSLAMHSAECCHCIPKSKFTPSLSSNLAALC